MGENLKFVVGSSSDIMVFNDARADEADRVLLMPYTKWYDYSVFFLKGVSF